MSYAWLLPDLRDSWTFSYAFHTGRILHLPPGSNACQKNEGSRHFTHILLKHVAMPCRDVVLPVPVHCDGHQSLGHNALHLRDIAIVERGIYALHRRVLVL
jgi:hypothetical protein